MTNSNKDIIFTVSQLTDYLKDIISNKKIKVTGEISQPKLSNGHLYFSIKDDYNNIKSIIWKSRNIDKNLIIEGQKVTLDCKLDFYGGTGNVNLIVDKIVTNDGYGELYIKYENIKKDFYQKGYFDLSRKKILPKVIKNILIITSENGAALQDFLYNLQNNNSNIDCDIVDVCVQGVDCPKNICKILSKLKKHDKYYDLVIITRGGGSFADLFGFSQPELIESVYDFHLPVLSAIGHQVDNPLLDLVADINTPTPSLAAQFIVDYNKKYINDLQKIKEELKNKLIYDITNRQKQYSQLNDKLYRIFNSLKELKNNYQLIIQKEINNSLLKLSILESKLNINNDIILFNNNNKINNPNELKQFVNKKLKLNWGDQEFIIKIIS